MIRKLRLRFVAAAMLSLVLVLAVILGIIATLNYRGIVSDVDGILQLLRRTDGRTAAGAAGDLRLGRGGHAVSVAGTAL